MGSAGRVQVPARLKVTGERELRAALKGVEGGLSDLKEVHKDAATVVAVEAKTLVPVRSGNLDNSIRAAGTARSAIVRAGGKAIPYAGPIHYGWPTRPDPAKGIRGGPIAPQPFLVEAFDHRRGEIMKRYEDGVDKVIAKHGLD